ncbi:MAG TPA: hypothetical protein PLB55_18550, partial [Prosthecobacter sp.]|nr:hypothetical protein [Prosthecobacter sp.]
MIPDLFARDLPEACRQVLLVIAPHEKSITAKLRMIECDSFEGWHQVGETIPVSLGRNGLAWGVGEHTAVTPAGFRTKLEGDGCSPAGVFRLPFAFGDASESELMLPYVPITESLMAVDDPQSRFYNQVVDAARVTKDWTSTELMCRDDGLYRWGALVAHNPMNLPGAGSCIFLHLWRGEGLPTAGCTAM